MQRASTTTTQFSLVDEVRGKVKVVTTNTTTWHTGPLPFLVVCRWWSIPVYASHRTLPLSFTQNTPSLLHTEHSLSPSHRTLPLSFTQNTPSLLHTEHSLSPSHRTLPLSFTQYTPSLLHTEHSISHYENIHMPNKGMLDSQHRSEVECVMW